jgi:hypothetical protein
VGHQPVEEICCEASKVGEVAVTMAALLLGSKKLDQDHGLPPSEFIHGVAMRGQVDEPCPFDMVSIVDTDGPYVTERSFEPTRPSWWLL